MMTMALIVWTADEVIRVLTVSLVGIYFVVAMESLLNNRRRK